MTSSPEKLNILKARIRSSKKRMDDEKKRYWSPCRDFFEGKHWPENLTKMRTINLIWSTVRTLLASQYFRNPHFTLKPLKPDFEGPIKDLHEAVLRLLGPEVNA